MAYSIAHIWRNSGNSATCNLNTPAVANVGDLLVFFAQTSSGGGTPTLTGVQDNNGLNWTIIDAVTTNFMYVGCAYAIAGSPVPTSVTGTWNGGTPGSVEIQVVNVTGIATSSPLIGAPTFNQQVGGGPGTGANTITSSALNFTSQPALALGFSYNGTNFQGSGTSNAGTTLAWTSDLDIDWLVIEDLRITSTGNVTATFGNTANGTDWYTSIVLGFKESSGSSIAAISSNYRMFGVR